MTAASTSRGTHDVTAGTQPGESRDKDPDGVPEGALDGTPGPGPVLSAAALPPAVLPPAALPPATLSPVPAALPGSSAEAAAPCAWLDGLGEAGRHDAALAACAAEVAAADPQDPEARAALDLAAATLEQHLRDDPGDPAARALLAAVRLQLGATLEAAGLLVEADLQAGGNTGYRRLLLRALALHGDIDAARRFARSWLRDDPREPDHWWFLAGMAEVPADTGLMRELSRPVLGRDTPDALRDAVERALARVALQGGDRAQARTLYRGLVQRMMEALLREGGMQRRLRPDPAEDTMPFLASPADEAAQDFLGNRPGEPGAFWQVVCETLRQRDWLALATCLLPDSMPAPANEDEAELLETLRALAQEQALRAPPHPDRAHSGVLKAHLLVVPVVQDYWLDSGSLLGPVRSDAAIAWDSDIDLGVWDDAVPALLELHEDLLQRGYRSSHRSYRGRIYGFTFKLPRTRPIHVHVFFRHGDLACSPQTLSLYKKPERGSEAPFRRMPLTQLLLRSLHGSAVSWREGNRLQRVLRRHLSRRVWGVFTRLRNRHPREDWPKRYPYSAIHAIGTWTVPARHFDRLGEIALHGVPVRVPDDHETYLALRYGNWREPRPDWVYWLDDGCLTPKRPEDCGFAALFS